jgi:hypothetical protein
MCITCIMYQQLWGYKVEEKLYLGVREQKRLNTTALVQSLSKCVPRTTGGPRMSAGGSLGGEEV